MAQVTPVSEDGPYARPTSLTGIPGSITLYQYEVCPFCCKVKAALDFYKVCKCGGMGVGAGVAECSCCCCAKAAIDTCRVWKRGV
eukprot:28974-Chlamydomonas_euryale.AAC.1